MEDLFTLQTLSWPEAFARVGLACLFGFVMGFDRSRKNKPIDFRVYMIVALSACLAAIMGQEVHASYYAESDIMRLDILRVMEGVLVGIGFLGAGAIIKSTEKQLILGTATGASIWSSGIIGLLLGFGLYGLSILGFVVVIIILVLFGYLRKPLFNVSDINDVEVR